MSYQLINYSD